jgi:hypothetical protein
MRGFRWWLFKRLSVLVWRVCPAEDRKRLAVIYHAGLAMVRPDAR